MTTMVKNKIKLEHQRHQCLKPTYYNEVFCYELWSLIDPTIAAGLIVKSPRLAKLIYNQADRLIHADRRKHFLPSLKTAAKRSLEKDLFISRYLNRDFTTVEQREKWKKLADEIEPNQGKLFFDSENSILKHLNDTLKDKDFVTSLNHKYKELMQDRLKILKEKYKDQIDFVEYSDYKSYRAALVPKAPGKAVPAELEKELAQAFKSANDEFTRFLQHNSLIRDTDLPGDWMRSGIGTTADEANFAARTSRDLSGPNELQNFSNQRVKSNLLATQSFAEDFRQSLARTFEDTPLFEKSANGVNLPKEEVFDILRKNDSEPAIRQALLDKFGQDPKVREQLSQKLDEATVHKLNSYKIMVDHFSPGMRSTVRKIISFDEAEYGGMSADFAGLGAKNLRATAEGVSSAQDLQQVIRNVRAGEMSVTDTFQADMSRFEDVVRRYNRQTDNSGDDFGAPFVDKPLGVPEKQKMLNELANIPEGSPKRIAFFGPKVPKADRMTLTTHGESLEKELRTTLEKTISPEKLKGLLFGVDMRGSTAGQGITELLIGRRNSVSLSEEEFKIIKQSFKRVVEEFNSRPDSQNISRRYRVP